jgi:hypothetical protein
MSITDHTLGGDPGDEIRRQTHHLVQHFVGERLQAEG